jgi:hypothetical protein
MMHHCFLYLIAWAMFAPAAPAQVTLFDESGDAVIRRTDIGADGPVDETAHAIPDIVGHQVGAWQPLAPGVDVFNGNWNPSGGFVRITLVFAGVVNPPGPLAQKGDTYDAYRYGPDPVYGFFEIDMDASVLTGGETAEPQFRYLANAARFGGKPPVPRYGNRYVLYGGDIDNVIGTPPYVERSGEEFHIALLGESIQAVIEQAGDGDGVYEPGELWIVRGPLFHRAHCYERFSSAGGDGLYEPIVDLRWESSPQPGFTFVSLVYPLTNAASALQRNEGVVQPMDGNDDNQNSVFEALSDLHTSVQAIPLMDPRRAHPAFPLIQPWENQNAAAYLEPELWPATLLVGMAYPQQDPSGAVFAWTDCMPGALVGDYNGDARISPADADLLNDFILMADGVPGKDADGIADGRVILVNFGPNFSVHDRNYDGRVDAIDRQMLVIKGDMDGDQDYDPLDVELFVRALVNPANLPPTTPPNWLYRADMDSNGVADSRDAQLFLLAFLAG